MHEIVIVAGATAHRDLPRRVELARLEVPVACVLRDVPAPRFDADAPHRRGMALIRVRGFSLNYRDRAGIYGHAEHAQPGRIRRIGSDFVAEVVALGSNVQHLQPGSRVIPDPAYPQRRVHGLRVAGLPSDAISAGLLVMDASRLIAVPAEMSDPVAASFTIAGATSFSMVRRAGLEAGERCLVLGGRAVTTLALLEALRSRGIDALAVARSPATAQALLDRGVEVVTLDPDDTTTWWQQAPVRALAGTIDVIFDPYADVHLHGAVQLLAFGGRYLTCGLEDQYGAILGRPAAAPAPLSELVGPLVFKNLTIIGNCLGHRSDLEAAIAAHAAGTFELPIDSVFRGDCVAGFLERSFAARDRLGKVPYVFA